MHVRSYFPLANLLDTSWSISEIIAQALNLVQEKLKK